MNNDERLRKILETDRISALTDAIFAFSMTLLIIGIAVPEIPKELASIQLGQKLLEIMPLISDFVLSFLLLAVFWTVHQKQFKVIKNADGRLSWMNLSLLLAVVFIPFTTELSAKYGNIVLAETIFNANILVISLLFYFIWKYAKQAKLVDANLSKEVLDFVSRKNSVIVVVSVAALMLGFIVPDWCTLVYLVIPFILMGMERKHKTINEES